MLRKHLETKNKGEYGFTLIELLVVIVIIGILASIAIPAFLNQKRKAEMAEAKSDLRNVAMSLEQQVSMRTTSNILRISDLDFRRSLIEANVFTDYNGPNRVKPKTMALCANREESVLVYVPTWSKTTGDTGETRHEYATFSNLHGLKTHQNAEIAENPANVYFLNNLCQHVLPTYTYSQWSQSLSPLPAGS